MLIKARQYSFAQSKPALSGLVLGLVVFLEILSYLLGSPAWFSLLFLIPLSLVTWRAGLLQGVLIATIGALPYVVCDSLSLAAYSRSILAYWNSAVRLEFFFIIILALSIWKMKRRCRQEKLAESTIALEAEFEKRLWAEAVLKNLGIKDEELRRNPVVGVHQSSLKGEILCVVDPLGGVYMMNSNRPVIRGPHSKMQRRRLVQA
jgi:hypothetical protein